MTDLFDLVYGMIFQPAATLRRLAQAEQLAGAGGAPSPGKAFAVVALAALVEGSAVGAEWTALAEEALGRTSPGAIAGLALVAVGSRLVTWFASAGVLHLVAESLGGNGRAMSLLALLGLCRAPGLLLGPLAVIPAVAGSGASTLASLALGVWVSILAVIAIRESYSMTTARAVAVVVLPLACVVLLALGSLAVLGAAVLLRIPGLGLE